MSNRILSYRGLLADGGQDTILLSTKKGEVGYRIHRFELMPNEPGEDQHESTVMIWKDFQSTINNTVDFSDNRLLACSIWQSGNAPGGADALWVPHTSIFDQEIFNQDVYVTHSETDGSNPINYYIEIEVIKLDESQAMVATLKDIRNNS
jgi:hypothetical protein